MNFRISSTLLPEEGWYWADALDLIGGEALPSLHLMHALFILPSFGNLLLRMRGYDKKLSIYVYVLWAQYLEEHVPN